MKRTLFVLALVLCATMSLCAQANSYRAKVERCLELTSVKESMVISVAQTWQSANLPIANCEATATAVINALWPDLVDGYTDIYRRYFTSADLDQLIAFYESPIGRRFCTANPKITMETAAFMATPRMQARMTEVMTQALNQ